jgi:hypothetical protein
MEPEHVFRTLEDTRLLPVRFEAADASRVPALGYVQTAGMEGEPIDRRPQSQS